MNWKNLEREWRKQLLSYARGNILEVGVEEGNNFKYYPVGVHVTATDISARMIEKAKRSAAASAVKTNFIISAVEDLQFPKNSFDTVVSTFSISAYENPVQVLKMFGDWCKPQGNILLLEYGLSKYQMVNWVQKKLEPWHYRTTGAHINRDMISIIRSAKLQIKNVEVRYAGVVYLVWASLVPETITISEGHPPASVEPACPTGRY